MKLSNKKKVFFGKFDFDFLSLQKNELYHRLHISFI